MAQALKHPDFRVLVSGRFFYVMALQAQAVLVGWHIYELSHDPFLLGLVGLVEAVPAIGFAFVAGHVVDSVRPASIYHLSLLTLFFNTLLIWSTTLSLIPADWRLFLLFAGVFISGIARSFLQPSVFTLVSHVVPRALLAEAAAYNSRAQQTAAILGPTVAGLLYGATNAPIAFAMPPLLLAGGLMAQSFFSHSTRQMKNQSTREPFWISIRAGVHFAFRQKVLLSAMTLDMFSVLFGGAVAILPMFSDQVLHAGSLGLGVLRAATSAGSGLVAIFLGFKPLKTISGTILLFAVAGFGASIIAFAFSTQIIFAVFFLVLSGVFDGISMVIRNTILQLFTPAEMRGRVSALSSVFITSSNEIGAFESGLTARMMGLIPSLIFGGTMNLMVVLFTAWKSPELRQTRIRPDAEK